MCGLAQERVEIVGLLIDCIAPWRARRRWEWWETSRQARLSSSLPEGNGFTMMHTQEEQSVLDTGTHGLTKWTRGGRDDS